MKSHLQITLEELRWEFPFGLEVPEDGRNKMPKLESFLTERYTNLEREIEGMKKEMVSHECDLQMCTHRMDVICYNRALQDVLNLFRGETK